MSSSLIACLTDFGGRDPYAGVLKAVALGIAPSSRWVDLTHAIAPGAVRQAALAVWQSAPYLPEGSILLGVVDPGVGSSRRPIIVAWDRLLAVGPDNGLFSYLAAASPPQWIIEIHPERIDPPHPTSRTFHGRDLFAVAAARLAEGKPVESLGDPISGMTLLPTPRLELEAKRGTITGEVIHFDHFGNAITSIGVLHRQGESGGLFGAVVGHDYGKKMSGVAALDHEAGQGAAQQLDPVVDRDDHGHGEAGPAGVDRGERAVVVLGSGEAGHWGDCRRRRES